MSLTIEQTSIILAWCLIVIISAILLILFVSSILRLICFIHYKITGDNSWKYKYLGSSYEQKRYECIMNVLDHINEFEETFDNVRATDDFLSSIGLNDEQKQKVLPFFRGSNDKIYSYDTYTIHTFNKGNGWLIKENGDDIIHIFTSDKYLKRLIDSKLKEAKII